jgi:hypothetical protein
LQNGSALRSRFVFELHFCISRVAKSAAILGKHARLMAVGHHRHFLFSPSVRLCIAWARFFELDEEEVKAQPE